MQNLAAEEGVGLCGKSTSTGRGDLDSLLVFTIAEWRALAIHGKMVLSHSLMLSHLGNGEHEE